MSAPVRRITLPRSPVAGSDAPVGIALREAGSGPPVLLLHGGWGYEAYPFDAALAALAPRHHAIAPDRAGYGGSDPLPALPAGFHRRMAEETLLVLDALNLRRAALWGHSDGAVVAAWAAILAPDRIDAVVLEALHFLRAKPGSLAFFRTGIEDPERYGEAVVSALARDHGPAWREVVARGARAWLAIIEDGLRAGGDLFDGRLGEVRAPVLLLHGRNDPRTEPGELEAAAAALRVATLERVEAGHSPHTSRTSGALAIEAAAAFLARRGGQDRGG